MLFFAAAAAAAAAVAAYYISLFNSRERARGFSVANPNLVMRNFSSISAAKRYNFSNGWHEKKEKEKYIQE